MKSNAPTVDAYLASLPDDRRAAIAAVRAVIVETSRRASARGCSTG